MKKIGNIGEDFACSFLTDNGYQIIARNYLRSWGEIDIVSKSTDGTLVFVEVKTMRHNPSLTPEDNLTATKLDKLRRTCRAFCAANPDLVNERTGWRIDLIAITLPSGDGYLTEYNKNVQIYHYENIS